MRRGRVAWACPELEEPVRNALPIPRRVDRAWGPSPAQAGHGQGGGRGPSHRPARAANGVTRQDLNTAGKGLVVARQPKASGAGQGRLGLWRGERSAPVVAVAGGGLQLVCAGTRLARAKLPAASLVPAAGTLATTGQGQGQGVFYESWVPSQHPPTCVCRGGTRRWDFPVSASCARIST